MEGPLLPRVQAPGHGLPCTLWCLPAREVPCCQTCGSHAQRPSAHHGTSVPWGSSHRLNRPPSGSHPGLPQGLRGWAGRTESPRVDACCHTPQAGGARGSPAGLIVLERPQWGGGQPAAGRWVGSWLTGASSCHLRVPHRGPESGARTPRARPPCPGGGSAGSRAQAGSGAGGLGRDSRPVPAPRVWAADLAPPSPSLVHFVGPPCSGATKAVPHHWPRAGGLLSSSLPGAG